MFNSMCMWKILMVGGLALFLVVGGAGCNVNVNKGEDNLGFTPTPSLVQVSDGTVGAPTMTFIQDKDTGFYRVGSGDIGVSSNGVKVADFSSTGLSITGSLNPATDLLYDLGASSTRWRYINAGSVNISGFASNQLVVGGQTATTTIGDDYAYFGQKSDYNSGIFSIDSSGNTSASGTLTIIGASTFNGNLTLGDSVGDSITVTGKLGTLTITDGSTTSTHARNSLTIGESTGFNQGIFSVSSAGNISASGALQVWGGAGTNVTSSIYTDLLVDNAMDIVTSTAITRINSISIGNLNFNTDAGIVSLFELPMSTTTAGIMMSVEGIIGDTSFWRAMTKSTTTAGIASKDDNKLSFFPDSGESEFGNLGGADEMNGFTVLSTTTFTNSATALSAINLSLISTSTVSMNCWIDGNALGSDNYFTQEINTSARVYNNTLSSLVDTSVALNRSSSTWAASSTWTGGKFAMTVKGEAGVPIYWRVNCLNNRLSY